MISPDSLIRTCDTMPEIIANANNICKDSLDCGITSIGWCQSINCQKKATAKNYLLVFVLIGILIGTFEGYFLFTAHQVAKEFIIDAQVIDWLLVTNGIIQGASAVIIGYWGNRIHRISWMGFILIINAVIALTLLIPTLVHLTDGLDTISSVPTNLLCANPNVEQLPIAKPHGTMSLILLFVLQVGNGLAHTAFVALGLSYLDDNVEPDKSPLMITVAYASRTFGVQLGSGLSLFVKLSPFNWWFGWAILSPIMFIAAILISLFPRRLITSLVRDAANDIIEVATNSSHPSLSHNKFLADFTFWSSAKRILTNKILVINSVATMFIYTAIINYSHYERSYMESHFFFPSSNFISNEWTSKIITSLLKPPIVALTIILSGFFVSKFKLKPRTLVLWNVLIGIVLILIFVSLIFVDCNNGPIAGSFRGRLTTPYCSSKCICSDDITFSPVCPEDSIQTYYSPCHAGCMSEEKINNITIAFSNCTCGADANKIIVRGTRVIDGGCRSNECQVYWIIFQILTVLTSAVLGAGLIANFLIQIRSVLPQDKSLALSLELTLIGIIVYIPGRIGFKYVYDSTCQLWNSNNNKCYLNESPTFGNTLNIISISLITIGTLFNLILVWMVNDLRLYDVKLGSHRSIEMLNRMDYSRHNRPVEIQGNDYNISTTPLLDNNSLISSIRGDDQTINKQNMNNSSQTNF